MTEVRIDPLSGQRVIVATEGTPRFAPFGSAGGPVSPKVSFTPIVDRNSPPPPPSAYPDLFWAGPAAGAHELIEVPEQVASLGDLDRDRAIAVLEGWRERMRAHADAACLHLFADESPGVQAHQQLLALDFVPAPIARERERFRGYATQTLGGNLLADLVQHEVRLRDRIVAIDSDAVLLSAYAARAPYQLTLVPRTARMRFEDDGPTGAALLHAGLNRLRAVLGQDAVPPLSLWVRTAPQGAEHFCWRIDVLPRPTALDDLVGLQAGAGLAFNRLSPEAAAAALRDAG